MEFKEVFKFPFNSPFKSPFTLIFSYPSTRFLNVRRLLFYTEEIQASVTMEEIYKWSIDCLKAIVKEYNQYQINGTRITESAYYLDLHIWDEDRKEWYKKKLYEIYYTIQENKIIREKKYYNNLEKIEGKFKIVISADLCIFEDYYTIQENKIIRNKKIL